MCLPHYRASKLRRPVSWEVDIQQSVLTKDIYLPHVGMGGATGGATFVKVAPPCTDKKQLIENVRNLSESEYGLKFENGFQNHGG